MGKQPAFQFYVGDWLKDTRCLSLEAKGAWIDLLNFMWHAETRGKLSFSWVEYSRQLGTDAQQAERVICELVGLNICDCYIDGEKVGSISSVTNHNKKVTLVNRRMIREEEKRRNGALRQAKFREKQKGNPDENHGKNGSNKNVTPHSSSSSSINNNNIYIKKKNTKRKKELDIEKTIDGILEDYNDLLVENNILNRGHRFSRRNEIRARMMEDGATREQFMAVAKNKLKDDYFLKNPKYFRPETIFCKKHWESYLMEGEMNPKKTSYTERLQEGARRRGLE